MEEIIINNFITNEIELKREKRDCVKRISVRPPQLDLQLIMHRKAAVD